MAGFFARLREGLSKTRGHMTERIDALAKSSREIDEDFYDELLDILILSDTGAAAGEAMISTLREKVRAARIRDAEQARGILKQIMIDEMNIPRPPLRWPMVMLVVGVNGVGKTTTVGKLALRFKEAGRSVVLAAADTFRAAADEQLQVWAKRADVPLIRQQMGADPAAVVFDAIAHAKARGTDLLIVDTAGRLHTKKNLMDELGKIRRIIAREYPGAEVRSMLVLDATTGQNGIAQARMFREAADISGIILTKLDGTARGGIAFAIRREVNVPVWYVGVGEGIDDLQAFDAREFVEALF